MYLNDKAAEAVEAFVNANEYQEVDHKPEAVQDEPKTV